MKRISFFLPFFLLCFLFGSCTFQVYVENHIITGDETALVVVSASCNRKYKRTEQPELTIGMGRDNDSHQTDHRGILSIDAPGLIIAGEYSDYYEYEITDFSDEKYVWDANLKKGKVKPTYFQVFLISAPEDSKEGSGTIEIHLSASWEWKAEGHDRGQTQTSVKLYYAYNAEHIYFSSVSEKDAIYSL